MREFFEEAYNKGEFLPEIKKMGYTTNLYLNTNTDYSNTDQLVGLADNLEGLIPSFDKKLALKSLLNLSAFRYAPMALKPNLWSDSTEFAKIVEYKSNDDQEEAYRVDDVHFYQKLLEEKLRVDDDAESSFMFYHFNGAHFPYVYNENVEEDLSGNVLPIQQVKGSFNIIYEYIDQMKELGVYDNTTIVIMADHGVQSDYPNELTTQPCVPAFFIKPADSNARQMKVSNAPVTTENLRATLVEIGGGDFASFGTPLFDVPENSKLVRKYYWRVGSVALQEFDIIGDANDIRNYTFVREHPLEHLYGIHN
jgi:hypothetical protein